MELSRHSQGEGITSGMEGVEAEAGAAELELNTDVRPADGGRADLPLQDSRPEQRVAAWAARGKNDPRWWARDVSTLTAVTVGFFAGLLFSIRIFTGAPDRPSLPAASNRTERAATPRLGPTDSSHSAADAVDVSGTWVVTNRVESTTYRAFKNLTIGYQLRLTQDGHRIRGAGHKWTENGRPIPVTGRTPIAIAGTLTGSRIDLRFTESGSRRTSGGAFVMHVIDERTLRGSFTSDAANSQGTSLAIRETAPAR